MPRPLRPRRSRLALRLACGVWAATLAAPAAHAQQTQVEQLETKVEVGDAAKQKGFNLLVVPLPVVDPALGNGVTLVTAAFYQPAPGGRPWVTGVGAMVTSNKNLAGGLVQQADLLGGRLRLKGFAGYGSFNLQYFGIGSAAGGDGRSLTLNEKGALGLLDGLYRAVGPAYLGARFRYLKVASRLAKPLASDHPLLPPDAALTTTISGLGPSFEIDTRDEQFKPQRGVYVMGQWLFYGTGLGGDFTYDRLMTAANLYRPIGRNTVIGVRASMCSVSQGAPFYDLCLFGQQNDLRGYQGGQYRDHAMAAAQVEVRQHLFWRIGAVAFGGVGAVAPDLGALASAKSLPAGGVGLRFQPARKVPVNVSIDYAWGVRSSGLYVYVGEAF